jgi:hypothetical protein
MKPSNVQNYRPLRSEKDSAHVGLNKQENLASFCQVTTIGRNIICYNQEPMCKRRWLAAQNSCESTENARIAY